MFANDKQVKKQCARALPSKFTLDMQQLQWSSLLECKAFIGKRTTTCLNAPMLRCSDVRCSDVDAAPMSDIAPMSDAPVRYNDSAVDFGPMSMSLRCPMLRCRCPNVDVAPMSDALIQYNFVYVALMSMSL